MRGLVPAQAAQDLAAVLTVDQGFLPVERALGVAAPMAWEFHACLAKLDGPDARVLALLADEGQSVEEMARRAERLRTGLKEVEAYLPGRILATVWVLAGSQSRADEISAAFLNFEDGHFLAKTLVGRSVLCLEEESHQSAGRRLPSPGAAELVQALRREAPLPEQIDDKLRHFDEEQRRAKALVAQGQPWATYALIGANIFAFMLTLMLADRLSSLAPLSSLSARDSTLQGFRQALLLLGANRSDFVLGEGQWWRLLSACFLHADALHLGMNMMALFSLGGLLERFCGPGRFLLIYLSAGILGSLASVLLFQGGEGVLSVGASGAILGAAGALMAPKFHRAKGFPRELAERVFRSLLTPVAMVFVLGLGLRYFGTGFQFDNWNHAGGLATGFLVSYIYPPLLQRRLDKKV